MNPYDFVPIDWDKSPIREPASPHDRFSGVSGKIEGTITAETPVFIFDSPKRMRGAEPFITNQQGQHIIPGSSLKGLFRSLVETVGNGCFLFFDRIYEDEDGNKNIDYTTELPEDFKKCETVDLCIACRMFGAMHSSDMLSLGHVSFNDAVEVSICEHEAVYTIALMGPKPRHEAFYLHPEQGIAGRKYYFHQPDGIKTTHTKTDYNEHITPVDTGSQFAFSLQFTNLETLELQTLLYTLDLEQDMRHKIGYAKPAGFGSVRFDITKLTLIDYASRYVANQGTTEYEGKALKTYLPEQTQLFTGDTTSPTLNALRRIWRWDPSDTTSYRYPSQDWFDENSNAPISDTL